MFVIIYLGENSIFCYNRNLIKLTDLFLYFYIIFPYYHYFAASSISF